MPNLTTGQLLGAEKHGGRNTRPAGEDGAFIYPECMSVRVPALWTELAGLKRNCHVPLQNEK